MAALIREGGSEGLTGVRAIGVWLESRGLAQISTNVEDSTVTPLAEVLAAVGRHVTPAAAELVGLAPEAALRGFPTSIPLSGHANPRRLPWPGAARRTNLLPGHGPDQAKAS